MSTQKTYSTQHARQQPHQSSDLAGFFWKKLRRSMSEGTATSKKPIIISSQLCSPHRTSTLGSGLAGLLGELSNQPETANLAPGCKTIGLSSRYVNCQLKL